MAMLNNRTVDIITRYYTYNNNNSNNKSNNSNANHGNKIVIS